MKIEGKEYRTIWFEKNIVKIKLQINNINKLFKSIDII